ncbi:MAG TPA: YsnF/AvaK domain-containing protein [Microvirga sp.]|jgi:uncharacterized protein (TIGR02271 family)|nr:YsnF/AvaK domain-containing protein [Microvirga sp.]
MTRTPDPEIHEERIALVEEEARIDKREVVTGRVRIRTRVEEAEETVRGTLDEEVVEVERVPVDRIVDAAPAVRQDGDVTIIPVMEEVLVVEKRLVLKEELHVRRRRTQESVEVPVTLRRERVEVERLPADETRAGKT